MIKVAKPTRGGTARVTFTLPAREPAGPVSVVGDFNGWDPFAHPLRRRSNGHRTAVVTVPAGATLHFRYLAEGGGVAQAGDGQAGAGQPAPRRPWAQSACLGVPGVAPAGHNPPAPVLLHSQRGGQQVIRGAVHLPAQHQAGHITPAQPHQPRIRPPAGCACRAGRDRIARGTHLCAT